MKKRTLKIIAIMVSFVIILTGISLIFASCGFDNKIKKASKNLNKYAIAAVFDDSQKTIEATETCDFTNKTDRDLDEIWFHLYGRAFRKDAKIEPYSQTSIAKCFPNGQDYGDMAINFVKSNGHDIEFLFGGQDEDILIVKTPVKKGESVCIQIGFLLTLSENTHRLGYFENNVNLGNWYPVICVFENGQFVADPYYSVGDPFYSDCSNYEVEFTYPSEYVLGSTGKQESEVQSNGKTTSKIVAKAVRDFAIILSKDFEAKTTAIGETQITYLGYTSDNDIDKNLETSKRALATFNELFGEYPYRTLMVAKTPFLFGGMEYPNLVWIADNVTDEIEIAKIIVHEIAHQWWYGVVGNNEVEYSYIDEAMAEYSTVMFFDKNDAYGYSGRQMVQDAALAYELYEEVVHSIKGTINDTLNKKTIDYSTEYEYVYVVYVRGTLFLDALRDRIGEKDFLKALKSYYKKFAFKNASRNDFLSAFSKASGEDLSDFFAEWKA